MSLPLYFPPILVYSEPFHCKGEGRPGSLLWVPPVLSPQAAAQGPPLPPPRWHLSATDAHTRCQLSSLCSPLQVWHSPYWEQVIRKSKWCPFRCAAGGPSHRRIPLSHICGHADGGMGHHSLENQVTLKGPLTSINWTGTCCICI